MIILWNATLLLYHLKQIGSKFKQYLPSTYYLLTVYDTRSVRPKHVFCRDTFRQAALFFLEIQGNTVSI